MKKIDLKLNISSYIIYVVFASIFIFFAIVLFNKGFLNPSNLMNIARQVAMISIMAIGMTFVLSAAEIDLSFGAVVSLSAVSTALILRGTHSILLAVLGGCVLE